MTNEPSFEAHSDKELIIDAICINCNKRFTSIRGVSMHLKMTARYQHSITVLVILDLIVFYAHGLVVMMKSLQLALLFCGTFTL
jgi:hypothetical protein